MSRLIHWWKRRRILSEIRMWQYTILAIRRGEMDGYPSPRHLYEHVAYKNYEDARDKLAAFDKAHVLARAHALGSPE